MPYILGALGTLLVLFIAVVLVRTFRFTPKEMSKVENEKISFDKERAIDNLAKLIKCIHKPFTVLIVVVTRQSFHHNGVSDSASTNFCGGCTLCTGDTVNLVPVSIFP